MKKRILLLLLLLIALPVSAADKRILPIGDSTYYYVDSFVRANPPTGCVIDTTCIDGGVQYGGKDLWMWTVGRGTGICSDSTPYGCLEIAPQFDIIWIYELGFNDIWRFQNVDCPYDDMTEYLTAWRNFYQNLHADFPHAKIVHSTGYPTRVTLNASCWQNGGFFMGGELTENPTGAECFESQDQMNCWESVNGIYRNFKNRLMVANADLDYVTYIDTWEKVATAFSAEELEAWHNARVPDCIHMEGKNYPYWYNTYLREHMEAGGCVAGTSACAEGEYCDEDNDTCVECLENTHCNDSILCNGEETCAAGVCVAGTDPCEVGEICDEGLDQC